MSAGRRWFAAAVLAVGGLGAGGAAWHPAASHEARPTGHTVAVGTRTLVCPNVTGDPSGLTTTMTVADLSAGSGPRASVSYASLFGAAPAPHAVVPRPAVAVTATAPQSSVEVDATGPGASRLVAGQVALLAGGIGRALTDSACYPPGTDWWFAGGDGRIGTTDTLFLANPAAAPANVSLTLWSEAGPLSPPGARGIVVPPHAVWRRNLADLVPDAASVALHVHADSGTVTAALYDRRYRGVTPAGGDWVPPTLAPARAAVVAGYAPYAGPKGLALANPGDRDASVTLRVVTAHGAFAPSGRQSVVVAAGHTLGLDLGGAIGADPAAVAVTSDAPVVTEGVSVVQTPGKYDEIAWQPAQPPLTGPSGLAATAPPFGQQVLLVVSAPRGAARLRVTSAAGATADIAVPAGRSVSVDLRAALKAGSSGPGPVVLTPEGSEPVYAMRVLYAVGSHGALVAAEPPTPFPADVAVPGVVADLRVAAQSSAP